MRATYAEFLAAKTQLAGGYGFAPVWLPDRLIPFQRVLAEWAVRRGRAAILADCGMGKGLPPSAPVLTPTGWRPIGDLRPGDTVIGSDGRPTAVEGVFHRGRQPLYRFTFSDGTETVCDADHLWAVKSYNDAARGKAWRVLGTRELATSKLKYGTHGQSRTWQVPLVAPVEFADRPLPIDPYLLGVLLGDGALSHGTVTWSKPDLEVADRVRAGLPVGVSLTRHDTAGRCPVWALTTPRGQANPVLDALRDLGLMGLKSHEKLVPEAYLYSSVPQRVALLQGLMDTDGYAGDSAEFCSTSKALASAVVHLARSLGGTASVGVKPESTYTHAGEKRTGRPAYRVVPVLPPAVRPFHVARKAAAYKPASRGLGRWIDSVEPVGDGESVCIKVAAADGLFVTGGFVVTHNTLLELVFAENVVRHANRPFLITTPLAVAPQFVREGEKFGVDVYHSRDGKYPAGARVVVTNVQRLHLFSPGDFAGAGMDESGGLKDFDGANKAAVTEFFRTLRFRLLASATAAPNDFVELGTHSEALGELGYSDMLGRFFKKQTSKDRLGWGRTKYKLRGYAERDFWRWVCSWARACRRPSDLGFADGAFVLPELVCREHEVRAARPAPGRLFDVPAESLPEQREELRRTLGERCGKVAELVAHDRPAVCWVHLNDEGDELERLIPDAEQVTGSMSDDEKEERLAAFAAGQIRVLVTKPTIAGYGLNWQHCAHQTYFPSHSFEQWYQGVRRCWRFGQTNPVTVDVVTTEGGAGVLANLRRKQEQADQLFAELVRLMNDSLAVARTGYGDVPPEVPAWLLA